ncbi:MAG: hypothetical protein HWE16_10360, partial [Gammaproteobacteria bacterium]|nr:hypothetical protein [Gammaproteobacteria bacterium]
MKLFASIREKFYRWVDARLPAKPEIQLRQKNIYILPTRYGWLMLGIILLILVAATNYQNNMGYMAGFVLLSIGALSTFYTYRNLRQLKIKVLKPEAVYAGEKATLQIEVVNQTEQYRASVGVGEAAKKIQLFDVLPDNSQLHQELFLIKKR